MLNFNNFLKREKRFLLFMPEYIMGGAETQFRYLINYAERNKWKVDVIIEHRIKKEIEVLPKSVREMKNVRVYEMDWRKADNKKVLFDTVVHVLSKIPSIKYSACLIHFTQDLALAPVLKLLGIYVIYSERIDAAIVSHNLSFQRYLWYCDRILANSVYAQEQLMKLTGRSVGVIRNGKPVVEQFAFKENRRIDRILVPANILPHKNQMLLIRYLKTHSNFQGKVVFAGYTVDKSYKIKLSQSIKKNNLQDRVEFLGYVENMEEEYRKADLVILPSFSEGTPNVVLEAYAYGRPVIVSDIGVEREIVRNPRLRFEIRSIDELDECIRYIQGLSDEAYQQMLAKNRQFVLRNYNMEQMVKAFYKELLEGKRHSLCKLGIMRLLHFHKSHAISKFKFLKV